MSYSNVNISFNQHFELKNKNDILKFFPENKKDYKQIVNAKIERLKHYLTTGVWINESMICEWTREHNKLSAIFQGKGKAVERKLLQHEANLHFEKDSLWTTIKTAARFVKEFALHPTEVGAILPSSTGLAREIVSEIPKDKDAPPRRILEVGPGTGPFTEKIIKRMNPQDTLVLVEFDEAFHAKLTKKFGHIKNVTIIQGDIIQHDPKDKYDFIISGLPLNSFKADFVNDVFAKFTSIIKDNGKISYFEYVLLPKIKRVFLRGESKENFNKILQSKESFYKKHEFREATVLMNCPPAKVLHHHVKAAKNS